MKRVGFLIYAWGSTFLFAAIIYWLATLPYFQYGTQTSDELLKVIFRMLMYAILFILVYRSIILTLKNTVERLSKYRSKGEESEDAEFVLIIETLSVIITILATILFSTFEVYITNLTPGRHAELKDVLVSTMAILLTGIVVYSLPIIGELEMAIKHKIEREVEDAKKKRSQ